MPSQHDKRKNLVFMLYMADFYEPEEVEFQLKTFLFEQANLEAGLKKDDPLAEYIEDNDVLNEMMDRYHDIKAKLGVIDPMIASVSVGWKLERMGKLDLQIMRVAVYEIFYDDSVPSPVAISEAVLLARSYGGEEGAPAFINGILGQLERNRVDGVQ